MRNRLCLAGQNILIIERTAEIFKSTYLNKTFQFGWPSINDRKPKCMMDCGRPELNEDNLINWMEEEIDELMMI